MFPMIISVLYLLWVIGAMIQMEDDDRWLYFVFLSGIDNVFINLEFTFLLFAFLFLEIFSIHALEN